ncbi:hypothetical protein FACS189462_3570 [Spirochaetia bacterium]|nr:hypothetical protein FACS189462_3570 [Spirochaetia bacterium]
MEQINAINFAPFPRKGVLGSANAKISLQKMIDRTGASHVILTPSGLQDDPQSTEIDFSGTAADKELIDFINFAQKQKLKVIMKPTVNCKNGTWRAFINFLDVGTAEETAWGQWFKSHEKFQLHYAKIARETGCVMFIAGCEMASSERREKEWRRLIGKVKNEFKGTVSYNTDKHHEDHVAWWDAVDVISSSGYYPTGTWEAQLDRIEKVVKQFNKPFFFAEIGTMSTKGSMYIPNSWKLEGDADVGDQESWYKEMFEHTKKRPWVEGYGLWSWGADLYDPDQAVNHKKYELYAKPAEKVVYKYFRGK